MLSARPLAATNPHHRQAMAPRSDDGHPQYSGTDPYPPMSEKDGSTPSLMRMLFLALSGILMLAISFLFF